MKVGDVVKIEKCAACPAVVGKTAKVRAITDGQVELNFGRGRPQANRPKTVAEGDVTVVEG